MNMTRTESALLRTGLQPVLVHMSKNAEGKFSFNPVSVNFLVELVKTGFAIIMLMVYVSNIRDSGLTNPMTHHAEPVCGQTGYCFHNSMLLWCCSFGLLASDISISQAHHKLFGSLACLLYQTASMLAEECGAHYMVWPGPQRQCLTLYC